MMFRTFLATTRPILVRFYSQVNKSGVYGLTEKEIADLRAVWKVVEEAPLPVSKLFFKELFSKKPEYQKKFVKYSGHSLIHNSDFIPHMRAVVVSLNKIIRRLEDEKVVNQVMDYIATSHKGSTVHREEFVCRLLIRLHDLLVQSALIRSPCTVPIFHMSTQRGLTYDLKEMGKSVKTTLKELNKRKFTSEMEAAFDKFWAAFIEDYVRRLGIIEKDMPKPPLRPPRK